MLFLWNWRRHFYVYGNDRQNNNPFMLFSFVTLVLFSTLCLISSCFKRTKGWKSSYMFSLCMFCHFFALPISRIFLWFLPSRFKFAWMRRCLKNCSKETAMAISYCDSLTFCIMSFIHQNHKFWCWAKKM